MGKLVQQLSGYRSDLHGPFRSTVGHAAKQVEAKHLASLEVMVRLQKHLLGHGSETAEPQQDSSPRGGQ